MFYDDSEPDFPNWWDALEDGSRDEEASDRASDLDQSSRERESASIPDRADRADRADRGLSGEEERYSPGGSDRVEQGEVVLYGIHESVNGYDREIVLRIWEYAEVIPGNDRDLWRKDEYGNWIYRLDYGRRESEFGWEIFDPGVGRHCQGVYAMRPLQWENYLRRYEAIS